MPEDAPARRWAPIVPRPGHPLVVGHRGAAAVAPENTLASFALAIDAGADIVELDVQLSADGVPVVIHDSTLVRTTDAERRFPDRAPWEVHGFTLDEIRALSAGTWNGTVQRVPTLREAVELVRDRDVGLLIETKPEHTGTALERIVGAEIRTFADWTEWVPQRLMVGSFDVASLRRARRELAGANLAFILAFVVADGGTITQVAPETAGLAEPGRTLDQLRDDLAAEGIGYLGMALLGTHGQPVDDFTATTVERFRAGGVELNLLTDDPDTMRSLTTRGTSSVLTNDPALATRTLMRR